jgi:Lamin Tail Domain
MRRWYAALATLAAGAVFAAVALADDFSEVYADYQSDGQVTPCRFTKQQLQNAKQQAEQDPYGTYTEFVAEVDREIARWDSGGCSGGAPPGTDPEADFSAVFADWREDGVITRCRFTTKQLQNALDQAGKQNDIDAYAPGFRDAVRVEIARKCADIKGGAASGGLKIVKIKAKGGRGHPGDEYVTIKNVSRGAVRLRGISLEDRSHKRIRLPRSHRLRRGRKLRVVTGCFRSSRRPARRGGRFYACKRGQLWNDRGDVVKLRNARGKILARRGFGSLSGVPRI